MINSEVLNSKSLIYLNDNSRVQIGRGNKKLIRCVEVFLSIAEQFLHNPKKIGTNWPKTHGIEMSLTLCGNTKIRNLNRDYRNKDKVTDVLSFPMNESLRDNSDIQVFGERLSVGDIVICRDVTIKQAKRFNISYEQELLHLMAHGFLHLCGFDHEVSEKEEQIMQKLESELVKKIYKKMGYE